MLSDNVELTKVDKNEKLINSTKKERVLYNFYDDYFVDYKKCTFPIKFWFKKLLLFFKSVTKILC